MRRQLLQGLLLLTLSAVAWESTAAPSEETPDATPAGLLAERGYEAFLGDDTQHLGASLQWGFVSERGHIGHLGPRIASAWIRDEGDSRSGVALGLSLGYAYQRRRIGPAASLGLDTLFREGDRYSRETTAAVGVRLRLGDNPANHYAIRIFAFRKELSGSGGFEDVTSFGVAVGLTQALISR